MSNVTEAAGKTHNLMFSATIPSWVSSIARQYLKDMQKISMIKSDEVKTA